MQPNHIALKTFSRLEQKKECSVLYSMCFFFFSIIMEFGRIQPRIRKEGLYPRPYSFLRVETTKKDIHQGDIIIIIIQDF